MHGNHNAGPDKVNYSRMNALQLADRVSHDVYLPPQFLHRIKDIPQITRVIDSDSGNFVRK